MSESLSALLKKKASTKPSTAPTAVIAEEYSEEPPSQLKSKRINELSNLFSKSATVIAEPIIVEETKENIEDDDENPFAKEEMSAQEKKDRDDRTVFVGNISLAATSGQIAKEFKEFGKIEKIWIRSLPIEESKMPKKASVILKQFKEGKDKKNAYLLFSTVEEATKSLVANGKLFMEKHLRVDRANQLELDFAQTVFVGNLHFKISDDKLREHFEDCGEIVNVRVIRDPVTHDGKGFGYVHFKTKEGFLAALKKNESELLKREIRVKKAVTSQRLDKKKSRIAEKAVSVNKLNAVKRLKSRLNSKAVVQDKEDVKPTTTKHSAPSKGETPKKAFNNNKGERKSESAAPGFVKKPIRKVEGGLNKPKGNPNDKNIFNGANKSREAQRKNRQAHGKKSSSPHPGAKKFAGSDKKKDFRKSKQ